MTPEGLRYTEALTNSVCSMMMQVFTQGDTIKKVNIIGGCEGNTQGVSRLSEGFSIDHILPLIEHIDCGGKGTSCPDQLAQVLRYVKEHPLEGENN